MENGSREEIEKNRKEAHIREKIREVLQKEAVTPSEDMIEDLARKSMLLELEHGGSMVCFCLEYQWMPLERGIKTYLKKYQATKQHS